MQQIGNTGRIDAAGHDPRRGRTPVAARHKIRRRKQIVLARVWSCWIAVIVLATAGGAILVPAIDWQHLHEALGQTEAVVSAAGFGIDEVTVTGHRFTTDTDIFDCLDLANVKTMATLEAKSVQARLLRLPWIATANISRVYPGRIDVAVTERTPFAVWLNGASAFLIDSTGRTLSPIGAADMPALPRIAGDGAPQAAPSLFQMIAHFPEIASRLQTAARITGRRWSLALTGGLTLELPSEGEATALAGLGQDESGRQLLRLANTVIDLRSRTQIAISPAGGL